jgi:hypothetical protein
MLHSGLGLFNARFVTRSKPRRMALFVNVARLAAKLRSAHGVKEADDRATKTVLEVFLASTHFRFFSLLGFNSVSISILTGYTSSRPTQPFAISVHNKSKAHSPCNQHSQPLSDSPIRTTTSRVLLLPRPKLQVRNPTPRQHSIRRHTNHLCPRLPRPPI